MGAPQAKNTGPLESMCLFLHNLSDLINALHVQEVQESVPAAHCSGAPGDPVAATAEKGPAVSPGCRWMA